MKEYLQKYVALRKHNTKVAIKKAKQRKMCYLFLAPYAILFFTFTILPVITSIIYSFTYYNIFEPARFAGLQNYISLVLEDDVFITGLKNTMMIAIITGQLISQHIFSYAVPISTFITIGGGIYFLYLLLFKKGGI